MAIQSSFQKRCLKIKNKALFFTLFLSFLFLANSVFSQSKNISQAQTVKTEEIATFIKVWGFLKYFHPNVANGDYNWEEEFVTKLDLLQKAKNEDEKSLFYSTWINSLGTVKLCKTCDNSADESKYFLKNMDFAWLENSNLFDEQTSKQLLFIKDNRYQKKPFYVTTEIRGQAAFINQGNDKMEQNSYPSESYRLLALAQYWNSVEYFFPYKYLTDQNWDKALNKMIPKFIDAKNATEFDLAKLEIVVKTDDGHANFRSTNTIHNFGAYLFPATLKIIDSTAIITSFRNPELAIANDLQVGDIILKCDDEKIDKLIYKNLQYVNGSNIKGKLRDNYYHLLNGANDSVSVLISRKGALIEKKVRRYPFQSIFIEQPQPIKYKIINNHIGYLNMESLEEKDVDQMMKEFQELPGLIIDLRNYPKFMPYEIASRFIKEKKDFALLTEPDLSFPSRFKFINTKTVSPTKPYYSGKVVLLVNEGTQSFAEHNTMLFQSGDNVVTLGSQTAGADGDLSRFYFSPNSKSIITGLGVYYPDRSETQRVGVKVDIQVNPTILGIQNGIDELLEEAIKLIDKKENPN